MAQQLELILASRHLAGSDRLKRFLRLIVDETLAGRGSTLKEYTIGVQMYDRGAAFDPKNDSIVRGEANRLRGRIADYYADPATQDDSARRHADPLGDIPVRALREAPGVSRVWFQLISPR